MKLGDLDFPVDDYDSLPYRDLIDFRDFLKKGLASPFWHAYREIVDGNARNFSAAILAPASAPSLDLAFVTEYTRGQLAATNALGIAMERLLEEVEDRITTLQAQGQPDDERRASSTSSEPGNAGAVPDSSSAP